MRDTFLSTAPGQELHYESTPKKANVEVETFEGILKERQKLNGEKPLTWTASKPIKHKHKSSYIPLKERTRTLSDVKDLDTTLARESAARIESAIKEEQTKFKLIEEALRGE